MEDSLLLDNCSNKGMGCASFWVGGWGRGMMGGAPATGEVGGRVSGLERPWNTGRRGRQEKGL